MQFLVSQYKKSGQKIIISVLVFATAFVFSGIGFVGYVKADSSCPNGDCASPTPTPTPSGVCSAQEKQQLGSLVSQIRSLVDKISQSFSSKEFRSASDQLKLKLEALREFTVKHPNCNTYLISAATGLNITGLTSGSKSLPQQFDDIIQVSKIIADFQAQIDKAAQPITKPLKDAKDFLDNTIDQVQVIYEQILNIIYIVKVIADLFPPVSKPVGVVLIPLETVVNNVAQQVLGSLGQAVSFVNDTKTKIDNLVEEVKTEAAKNIKYAAEGTKTTLDSSVPKIRSICTLAQSNLGKSLSLTGQAGGELNKSINTLNSLPIPTPPPLPSASPGGSANAQSLYGQATSEQANVVKQGGENINAIQAAQDKEVSVTDVIQNFCKNVLALQSDTVSRLAGKAQREQALADFDLEIKKVQSDMVQTAMDGMTKEFSDQFDSIQKAEDDLNATIQEANVSASDFNSSHFESLVFRAAELKSIMGDLLASGADENGISPSVANQFRLASAEAASVMQQAVDELDKATQKIKPLLPPQ